MAVIKREKPVVLTGAASSFLSAKRMNEKKAKQYVSSIAKKAPKNKLK